MIRTLLAALVVLTPLTVLLSGMAMTPLLVIFALLTLACTPPSLWLHPGTLLPNYRTLAGLLLPILAVPLLYSPWSFTPAFSFGTAGLVAMVLIAGAIAFTYSAALPAPGPGLRKAYACCIGVTSVLVLQERLLGDGLIAFIYDHAHLNYFKLMAKDINRGLCALTVLIWPLMLAFYRDGRAGTAWKWFALMASAILVMHSLSAKVGLAAGVLAFYALRRYPVTVGRAITVLFPLFLLSFPLLFNMLETTLFAEPWVRDHLPDSALHRLRIWHVLMEQVMQKPWLGWGIDTTRVMPLSPEALDYIHLYKPPLHPHSTAIQVLLEEGVIGLVLTVGAIALLLREWMRMPIERELARATGGALIVAYCSTGLSSFGIWQYWWLATLWIAAFFWRWMGRERVVA